MADFRSGDFFSTWQGRYWARGIARQTRRYRLQAAAQRVWEQMLTPRRETAK